MKPILFTVAGNPENQDRGLVIQDGPRVVLCIADGAGGLSGGEEAAIMATDFVRQHSTLASSPEACSELLRRMDATISKDAVAGETTCVLIVVTPDEILGASVGDSGAWLIPEKGVHLILTQEQQRKPLIGSDSAWPVSFQCSRQMGCLLLATDGLFKYTSAELIVEVCRQHPTAVAAQRLIELVRYASGALPDDVTVILTNSEDEMNPPASIFQRDRILGGLWGSLVGDALGVPVEFMDRAAVQSNPVTSMREFGTYHQPRGTWSDDGALILCTADSLLNHEFSVADMGERFVRWMNEDLWTANGVVFDIGGTTSAALLRIARGILPDQAGGQDEDSNGNGSLMRILPVVLRFAGELTELFASRIEQVSAITHGHARSKMACVFYGLVIRQLLLGRTPLAALDSARREFTGCYERAPEFARFRHLVMDDFHSLHEGMIVSTGYVLHTLHASLWCLLTTNNYHECVLKAVNLGGDTDTTGCVAGGLAGVAYGVPSVPGDWICQLPRKGDLDCLFHEFADLCSKTAMKGATSK